MMIGILGGGLTGLSLAHFLQGECEVLEKEDECGGLCRSHRIDGYIFDNGGHILFSRDRALLDTIISVLGDNVRRYRRNNKVFYKGRYVKYPFENGLADLSKEDNFECLYHYLTDKYPAPKNFKEWIYYTFGKGIADKYMIPYNEKIWNIPAGEMSLEWVNGRIPKPPPEDVIKSALGIRTEGYTHQLNFYYPKRGGIQALIGSLKSGLDNIVQGYEVKKICRKKNSWIVSDDKDERVYDHLISTIPIFHLAVALDGMDRDIKKSVSSLRYNSLIVVFLGLRGDKPNRRFAVYFPNRSLLYHRVCFYGFFGDSAVPEGKSSAVAEITFNEGDAISKMTEGELVGHVEEGLIRDGIIRKGQVECSMVHREKYAYVVFDRDYSRNVSTVRRFFERAGIDLCGRFSRFEYLNMDACIKKAMDLSGAINSEKK